MTCIVGLKHQGKVYMGADSANGSWKATDIKSESKLFRCNRHLIGMAGSPRAAQIIKHDVALPKPKANMSAKRADAHMFKLCNAFMAALEKQKHAIVKNSQPTMESQFLVAWGEHLYSISGTFQYNRYVEDYLILGYDTYSDGSLSSTVGMKPKQRIRLAMEAEAYHSRCVRPPYRILST